MKQRTNWLLPLVVLVILLLGTAVGKAVLANTTNNYLILVYHNTVALVAVIAVVALSARSKRQ